MTKIQKKTGNLMNVVEGHIVHGCNARGVMGSGVALAVRRKFPNAYNNYIAQYAMCGLTTGKAYPVMISDRLYVWNAITQEGYGAQTRNTSYDAIASCFEEIDATIKAGIPHPVPAEVHIPMIGAARGGGNWEIIREIIEQTMSYPVTLWLPDETVDTK